MCSRRNIEQAKKLGADEVMDYGVRDFTKEGMKIHLILDGPVNHSLDQIEGALKESVHYVAFGFSMESILIGPWKSFRTEKKNYNPDCESETGRLGADSNLSR